MDFFTVLPQVRPWYLFIFRLFVSIFVLSPCKSSSSSTIVTKLPEIPAIARNQSSLESFTGLYSGKKYSLNDSYPNGAVIRHVFLGGAIIANDTESYTFKCHVIHPVIHPQVHYRILLEDSSTLIFTGGRRNEVEVEPPEAKDVNGTASWEAEYEFEVQFTTNMTRGECLGMDVYNGTWREDGLYLSYAYARVPTLKGEPQYSNNKRLFTAGENYRLECPINHGFPVTNVTWILPSGAERQFDEYSDGELLVLPVQDSDEGLYTCVAKNKYGNVSYTYQVELRYPPIWEYLTIKLRRFGDGCYLVYSLAMMMLAHIRWF